MYGTRNPTDVEKSRLESPDSSGVYLSRREYAVALPNLVLQHLIGLHLILAKQAVPVSTPNAWALTSNFFSRPVAGRVATDSGTDA
jgi:hypothetical protein